MASLWGISTVLLLVKAVDRNAASVEIVKEVAPLKLTIFSQPFLEASHIWAFEVTVEGTRKILKWANYYKDDGKPFLVSHFQSTCAGCKKNVADVCQDCANEWI